MADERPQDNGHQDPDSRRVRRNAPSGGAERRGNGGSRRAKQMLIWVILFLLSMVLVKFFSQNRTEELQISYSSFRQHLANGNIRSVVISEKTLSGEFVNGAQTRSSNGQEKVEYRFKAVIPFEDAELIREMEKQGVEITAKPQATHWLSHVLTWLPWLIFIAFWMFLFRQMQSGQKGVFSFGKSRAKMLAGDRPKVMFSDVAGVEEAKRDLQEIVEFLKEPEKFRRFGARLPKGALLLGPPGTGKTLLARAVAGEAGVPFFSMSGSDFVEMFVGVGASRVRDLFEQGKKNAPCIIFIDELDAVGRHRGAGLGGGHDEREQTLNQLLVEMDGFDGNDGVILIAATNRPDVLDPALLRPGRFDRHITVDRPDVKGREQILKIKTGNKPLSETVDLSTLAKLTPGMSGADLENVVNEAALLAARENHTTITMEDLERAKNKIVMGSERKLVLSEEERKTIAYHEAGHTIIFEMIPEIYKPHSVTIVSRGRALGVTYSLPSEDQYLHSSTWCLGHITSLLGGQTAERMTFGDITNGASDDINRATDLARRMVCDWGMSPLGPMALGKKDEEIFLGREIAQHRDYSDQTAVKIDEAIRGIIEQCRQRAETILHENKDLLDRMAEALLEHETLNREQLGRLFGGETLEPVRPVGEDTLEEPAEQPSLEIETAPVAAAGTAESLSSAEVRAISTETGTADQTSRSSDR